MNDGQELLYVHLPPQSPLPALNPERCKVVLLARQPADLQWEKVVAEWVLEQQCFYFMAWGVDCSGWEWLVDFAFIKSLGENPLTDENLILTTSHNGESLQEVLWYCEICAAHPIWPLHRTLILDIGGRDEREEVLAVWQRALEDECDVPDAPVKPTSFLTRAFNRMIKPA